MSVKSEIWVAGFLRRCFGNGLTGVVAKRGAPEAGAIYIAVMHLDGTCHLFAPAPGPAYGGDGERRFVEERPGPFPEAELATIIARKQRVDPDIWVVEVEDRRGTAGLPPGA
jgi:hypothetical protein